MKIDLHTHSVGSPDGGLTGEDYRRVLENGQLDYVAITDHGTVEMALKIQQKLGKLGKRVIIGEEIKTTDGELIGLYLTENIPEGLSPIETIGAIKAQGGLVYVPHPFETVRSGMSERGLESVIEAIDIIETHNGRAYFGNKGSSAAKVAARYHKATAAASDAHGRAGWARTASIITEKPNRENLVELLKNANQQTGRVGIGILYPKCNRLKKKFSL